MHVNQSVSSAPSLRASAGRTPRRPADRSRVGGGRLQECQRRHVLGGAAAARAVWPSTTGADGGMALAVARDRQAGAGDPQSARTPSTVRPCRLGARLEQADRLVLPHVGGTTSRTTSASPPAPTPIFHIGTLFLNADDASAQQALLLAWPSTDRARHHGGSSLSTSGGCFVVAETGVDHNSNMTLAERPDQHRARRGRAPIKFQNVPLQRSRRGRARRGASSRARVRTSRSSRCCGRWSCAPPSGSGW